MSYFLGKSSLNNLVGVDPRVKEILTYALTISPIDFGVPYMGGKRTAEEQNRMYLDPTIATKCDGYKNISNHQLGKSFDIFAYVDGAASWDELHLTICAAAILQAASHLGHKLEWGGLWPWDKPHFNIID